MHKSVLNIPKCLGYTLGVRYDVCKLGISAHPYVEV